MQSRRTRYGQRLIQLYDLLAQIQQKAFDVLSDDDALPLNSLLAAISRFSLQTSARNQWFGTITARDHDDVQQHVDVLLADGKTRLKVAITAQSGERLGLDEGKGNHDHQRDQQGHGEPVLEKGTEGAAQVAVVGAGGGFGLFLTDKRRHHPGIHLSSGSELQITAYKKALFLRHPGPDFSFIGRPGAITFNRLIENNHKIVGISLGNSLTGMRSIADHLALFRNDLDFVMTFIQVQHHIGIFPFGIGKTHKYPPFGR